MVVAWAGVVVAWAGGVLAWAGVVVTWARVVVAWAGVTVAPALLKLWEELEVVPRLSSSCRCWRSPKRSSASFEPIDAFILSVGSFLSSANFVANSASNNYISLRF